jgi:hypothetical protein
VPIEVRKTEVKAGEEYVLSMTARTEGVDRQMVPGSQDEAREY